MVLSQFLIAISASISNFSSSNFLSQFQPQFPIFSSSQWDSTSFFINNLTSSGLRAILSVISCQLISCQLLQCHFIQMKPHNMQCNFYRVKGNSQIELGRSLLQGQGYGLRDQPFVLLLLFVGQGGYLRSIQSSLWLAN